MQRITDEIRFRETKIASFSDFVQFVFEYALFFRWNYFKNNPRGNLLVIRATLGVSMIAGIYYSLFSSIEFVLEGIEVDPILLFAFTITIAYWNMTAVFHKKSEYVSQLYSEYLSHLGKGDLDSAKLIANFLSIQLLALDLWAHRAFSGLLARNLEDAIEACDMNNKDELISSINAGEMDVRSARILLQKHQEIIKSNLYSNIKKMAA